MISFHQNLPICEMDLGPLFCFDQGERERHLNFFFPDFSCFLLIPIKKKHMQNDVVLVVLMATLTEL